MTNLSQNEIDALIGSIGGRSRQRDDAPLGPRSSRGRSSLSPKRYRLYDFRRPDKLSKDAVRLLRTVFGRFPRASTNYLAGLTRTSVDTTITDVDQTTYAEIFKSHGIPSLMCTFTIGEDVQGMLKLNLNQLYATLDRVMGGSGSGSVTERPLTDFERSLMSEICFTLLGFYKELVETDGEVRIETLDTDERVLARSLPADEIMVRALYDLRLGSTNGHLSFYTPLSSLSRILGKMSRSAELKKRGQSAELPKNLSSLALPVSVELGSTNLTATQIAQLQSGDVLCLNQETSRPLRVKIGGVSRFAARPGLLSKRMAVVVEGLWREGK